MKKIISLISLLSLLLVINVKADMGPPAFPNLQARITNANGVTCNNKKLNHGDIVTVYKLEDNSNRYAVVENECQISDKDIVIITDSYDLSAAEKYEKALDVKVVKQDGVPMYEGPDTKFKKLADVPSGTVMKSTHHTGTYWHYVDYNGTKGWVTGEDNAVVHSPEYDDQLIENITYSDLEITDKGLFEGNKVIGTLPANVEISDYWVTDYTRQYYLTYNGVTGFVSNSYTFAKKCTGTKATAKKSVKVYEKLVQYDGDKTSLKVLGNTEVNKEYDVKYCLSAQGWSAYYLTSLNGWVEDENDNFEVKAPTEPEDPKEPEQPEKPEEEPKKEEEPGLTNDQLIMICVGAGVLVAITILVTIVLVNKRKKKEENTNNENKEVNSNE